MKNNVKLGIQLYTVRDITDDDKFKSTLQQLADMGFNGVEFAWKYGGMEPQELADFIKSLNLSCCGLHTSLEDLTNPESTSYKYAQAVQSPFVTTSLAGEVNKIKELIPQINKAGETAQSKGMQFTYHNHWQEFETTDENNTAVYDILVNNTDPKKVYLELDIGWAYRGGRNPMSLWKQLSDRLPQIHLKDYDKTTAQVCDVGNGFINLKDVIDQAEQLGTKWLIFEEDVCPVSSLQSARNCAELWKKVSD
jgi:sugar phosphate isomerase/epimerase